MKNPPRENDVLDTRIEIRVSTQEKNLIIDRAKALGLSVSDYIRRVVDFDVNKTLVSKPYRGLEKDE